MMLVVRECDSMTVWQCHSMWHDSVTVWQFDSVTVWQYDCVTVSQWERYAHSVIPYCTWRGQFVTVAMPSHQWRKAPCTAVGEPENAMKCRKALLSEEQLLVTKERDKVRKVSKRASETCEQTFHRQEQKQTHLACAEGSACQCCSFLIATALL